MSSWKIGSIINSIFGSAVLIMLILLLGGVLPDSGFTRVVGDYVARSNIFKFGVQHWWRFVLFLVFFISYFILTVGFPLSILNKSAWRLSPTKEIDITIFKVYVFFGIFTPGGLFFLIGLFFIKDDLWRIRENKFRDEIEELKNTTLPEEEYESDYDDYNDNRESFVVSGLGNYDGGIQEGHVRSVSNGSLRYDGSNENGISKKVDRLERRLDDVEDDLYYQKRKTRKADKVLDDIQDTLDKR